MGRLVGGIWDPSPKDPRKTGGRFVRSPSAFRNWITADGSSGFPAAAGRYRLIVSHACPSRTPARGPTAPSSSAPSRGSRTRSP